MTLGSGWAGLTSICTGLRSNVPPNTITRRFPGRCEERLRSFHGNTLHNRLQEPPEWGRPEWTPKVQLQQKVRNVPPPPCQTGLGATADLQAFRGQWCPLLPWMQRGQPGQDSNNGPIESDRAGISEEFRGCEEVLTMQLARPRTGATVRYGSLC